MIQLKNMFTHTYVVRTTLLCTRESFLYRAKVMYGIYSARRNTQMFTEEIKEQKQFSKSFGSKLECLRIHFKNCIAVKRRRLVYKY